MARLGEGLGWDSGDQVYKAENNEASSERRGLGSGLGWDKPVQTSIATKPTSQPKMEGEKKRKATKADYAAIGASMAVNPISQMIYGAGHAVATDKGDWSVLHKAAKAFEGATEPQHSPLATSPLYSGVDFSNPELSDNMALLGGMVGGQAALASTGIGLPGAIGDIPMEAVRTLAIAKQGIKPAAKYAREAIGNVVKTAGKDLSALGGYASKLADMGAAGASKELGKKALEFGAQAALHGGTMGLGAAGGIGAVELAKKLGLDEKLGSIAETPQEAEDLQKIAHTLAGGVGGVVGGGLSKAGSKVIEGATDILKSQAKVPTSSDVKVAKQYSDILNTPEGQQMIKGGKQVSTPETTPNFDKEITKELGFERKFETPEEIGSGKISALNKTREVADNAYKLTNQLYKNVEDTVGDAPIKIKEFTGPDGTTHSLMDELYNISQLKDSHGTVQAVLNDFKQSIPYTREKVMGPALSKGELPLNSINKLIQLSNSLRKSFNLSQAPGYTIEQLNVIEKGLRDSVLDHLQQGAEQGLPGYDKALQSQLSGNKLYHHIKNSEASNDILSDNEHWSRFANKENAYNAGKSDLINGKLPAHLENITRAMAEVPEGLVSDHSKLVTDNMNKTQDIFNTAQQIAAKQNKSFDLSEGYHTTKGFLNEATGVAAPKSSSFLSPPETTLGGMEALKPFMPKGEFSSKEFSKRAFDADNIEFTDLLRSIKTDNQAEKMSPAINKIMSNSISGLFKQGAEKGRDTPKELGETLASMNNAYNHFKDTGKLDLLSPENRSALETANQVSNVMAMGKTNRQYMSKMNDLISKFNPNSPNAAEQAARIKYNLEVIEARGANQAAVEANKDNKLESLAVEQIPFGKKLMSVLNYIVNSDKAKKVQAALADIREGVTNPEGRSDLSKRLAESKKTLDLKDRINKADLIKATGAGVFAGGQDVNPRIPQISDDELRKIKLRNEATERAAKNLSGAL